MSESKFLEQRIIKLWQLYKVPYSVGTHNHTAKVKCAIKKLNEFSTGLNIPLLLALNQYAFYFVYLAKEKSFNKVYLKTTEFFDSYTAPKADISLEDIEYAYRIEDDWNSMHKSQMNDFPFALKSTLLQSGVKIMGNTFFEHSHSFHDFAIIANFVRHSRRNYPQIHSMKEFFIHLPIIKKRGGKYFVWQYVEPEKTLDQYYNKMYGNIQRNVRFEKFVSLLGGNQTLTGFDEVWGLREMRILALSKEKQDDSKHKQEDIGRYSPGADRLSG
jgi:hypothetical protein